MTNKRVALALQKIFEDIASAKYDAFDRSTNLQKKSRQVIYAKTLIRGSRWRFVKSCVPFTFTIICTSILRLFLKLFPAHSSNTENVQRIPAPVCTKYLPSENVLLEHSRYFRLCALCVRS